jgi:ferredoxin-NADP reductase
MICGPAPMLDTVEDALIEIGVPAKQIVSEKFEYG